MTEIFGSEPDLTTPALLDADDARGLLVFERMPPLERVSAGTPEHWFARVGRALAIVHERLTLPGDLSVIRRADRGRSGLVFVHGDFMPGNLGLADGRLIVFDWGVRPWSTELYTLAAPSVDLAAFLGPWLVPRWWDWRLPSAKLRALLAAYLQGVRRDVAVLAEATLGAELAAQRQHRCAEIRRRAAWRRPLARAKFGVNRLRLQRALTLLPSGVGSAR